MNRFFLCDEICGRSRFRWHQLTFALGCLTSISRRGLHSYGLAIGWALLSVLGPFKRNQPMIARLARWWGWT